MYELKKWKGIYEEICCDRALVLWKKNLPGRGLTKVEKHCSIKHPRHLNRDFKIGKSHWLYKPHLLIFHLKDMWGSPSPPCLHTPQCNTLHHIFLLRTLHISFPSSAPKSGNSIDSLPLQLPLPLHPTLQQRTYTQNHPRRLCKAAKLHSSAQMDYHYLGRFIRNTSQPQNTVCLQRVGHGAGILIVLGTNLFGEQRDWGGVC